MISPISDATGTHIELKVCGTTYTVFVSPANLADIKKITYQGLDITRYLIDVMKDELIEIEDELVNQLNKMNQLEIQLAA